MATTFQSELDGTNGATVTVANSGFDVVTGAWTYDTTNKASGTASALLSLTAATGMLTRIHATPVTTRGYDFMYRLSSLDGGNIMMAQIRLGSTNLAHLDLDAAGHVLLKNINTSVDTSATTVNLNEWFRIQWLIDGSTQSARLWVAATVAGLYNSTPTETMSGAYSQGSWDQIKFGCNVTHTLNAWVDRVVGDDTTWPNIGSSGNATPTANAGPDQSKTAGQTVTMAGSGTDPDGTIASYAWTQVSGPSITLSSATAQNPTFTAPAVSAASDVVLGLRVTDNGGAVSAQDTVTITVSPGSSTPTVDFYELFNTGPAGTTVTTSNTGMTSVDAGVTFTADAIGEGAFAVTGTSSAAIQVISKSLTAGPIQYIDFVFKIATLSSGGPFYIARVRSGTTVRASVRVNADGTIQTRNGTTAGSASTATVTAGQPFRIAWHLDNTATTQEARLYTGANLWGTTPDTGGTITQTFNTGTFDGMSLGMTLAATATWTADSLQIDDTTWPAPLTGGTTTPHSNLWVVQSDGSLLERTLTVIT